MSIGETLGRARRDAGLSIAEISNRTRIRLSVIDDIEHDNYSACGGDRRARVNIVAIARALGVDSRPLIEEYAAARRPAGWIVASEPPEPEPPEPDITEPDITEPDITEPDITERSLAEASQEPAPDDEPAPLTAAEDTQPIAIGQLTEPAVAGEPASPLTIGESAIPVVPVWNAIHHRTPRPVSQAFAERPPLVWIVLGGALVVAAALGGILLVLGASGQARHAVAGGQHHTSGGSAAHPARTHPSPRHSARSPGRTRPAPRPGGGSARALVPASIAAFGPGGTDHGDSPQLAHQALAGKAAAPWHSAWYATAHFGNLQSGTGLLLDMGRSVTITSARIALGDRSGADLALRIGSSPTLADLRPVAQANDAGGVVQLKTAPKRGRYVLVWFTRLPSDQAGTFQASVYDIKLRGRP